VSAPLGIVTPEAVVLEFETAGMASRLLAAMIDLTIQVLLVFVISFAGFGLESVGNGLGGFGTAVLYASFFLVLFGYPAGFETLWRGKTPGKAAMGLRVVTVEGAPVRFRHAAIRSILGLVDKFAMSGMIGVIAVLVSRRNQRLGDMVAGTIVLRERSGAGKPRATVFAPPYGLEAYTASLDPSTLGNDDYAAVRGFLLRAHALAPESRWALAISIAGPLRDRLRTTPPDGVGPEPFLVCVAAAYQRRHGGPAAALTSGFSSVWRPVAPTTMPATSSRTDAPTVGGTGFVAPG